MHCVPVSRYRFSMGYIISVGASISSSGVYSPATNRGLSDSQCADEQCSKAQSKLDEITCEMLRTECFCSPTRSCFVSDMTDTDTYSLLSEHYSCLVGSISF